MNMKVLKSLIHLADGHVDIDKFLNDLGLNCDEFVVEEEMSVEGLALKSTQSKIKEPKDYADPVNTRKYKLKTYKWGAKTWAGKYLQDVFGPNSWKDVNIDGRHRIKVKLYQQDHIWAKTGVKAKFQYLKHFKVRKWGFFGKKVKLYSTYVKDKADEMVIGFEHFLAYTDFETFGDAEKYYYHHAEFVNKRAQWSDLGTRLVKTHVVTPTKNFITGWANRILWFQGTIDVAGYSVGKKVTFNKTLDKGVSFVNGKMRSQFDHLISQNYPKAADLWSLGRPNRRYTVLVGEHVYKNKEDISCIVGGSASFGVGYNSNSTKFNPKKFGVFKPNKSKIQEACVFVAAKKKGKWAGVRVYSE